MEAAAVDAELRRNGPPHVGTEERAADLPAVGVLPGVQRQSPAGGVAALVDRPGRDPLLIGLDDVIDVDMPPVAAVVVDDFDAGGAAAQIAHVPQATPHPLVVGAGGRVHDLSVDEEVDAGLVGMIPAADQEGDVAALDAELRRGKRSHRLVALDHGIGVAVALIGPIPLVALLGAAAEGVAGHGPIAVVGALEVGDEDVRPLGGGTFFRRIARCRRNARRNQCDAQCQCNLQTSVHDGLPWLRAFQEAISARVASQLAGSRASPTGKCCPQDVLAPAGRPS